MHYPEAGPSTPVSHIPPPARDTQPSCALVFHPPSHVSPTGHAPPKLTDPLVIPVPTRPSSPYQSSTLSARSASSLQSADTGRYNGFRRGSMVTTPTSEMPRSTRFAAEGMELTSVAFKDAPLGKSKPVTGHAGQVKTFKIDKSKEEQALAKWRKWIVEQPIQAVPIDTSPMRTSSRNSPASTSIPMVPLPRSHSSSSSSPLFSATSSLHSPRTPAQSNLPPRNGSAESQSLQPVASGSRYPSNDFIMNTDSVRALQYVELAVDEDVLAANAQRAESQLRRMSTNPRVSETENPFIDIASRLGSRRVRPTVLELVQALAHFIDAVWCITYPDQRCPWIIEGEGEIRQSLHQSATEEERRWTSRMITAVQEGKSSGHVTASPTDTDVAFWGQEVRFALRDVDEVVGIYKGVGWAFSTAISRGGYGEVMAANVLGEDGRGGHIARLLNDLEEAMWGDAMPRPSDLAYDLPYDFDPYAAPDPDDLGVSSAPNRPFADFSAEAASPKNSKVPFNSPDDIFNIPDLIEAGGSEGGHSDIPLSPVAPDRGMSGESGTTLTLQEIGKRRHMEWLDSRRAEGGW